MNKLFLGFIIAIAVLLRFVGLGSNPPSLTWDEVAWGYNAYSLGFDLTDEFGKFAPFTYLESFGDFKPPMYAYLDIIPIKIFGLTEFAVRLPSAFFRSPNSFINFLFGKTNLWKRTRRSCSFILIFTRYFALAYYAFKSRF